MMKIYISSRPKRKSAITFQRLKQLIEIFEKEYPSGVLVLNETDDCLDVLEILNNGGDTKYLAQILWE